MRGPGYLLQRIAFALSTVVVAIGLNFLLFRVIPGDATESLLCRRCTAEFNEYLRDTLGLSKPLLEQFWIYVTGLLQGDLGTSLNTRGPVAGELWTPISNTIAMMALGIVFAVVGGVAFGLIAVWRRTTAADHVLTWSALTFNSLPAQWLGLLIVMFVAERVGLPSSGIKDPLLGLVDDASSLDIITDRLKHMILPALTLALVLLGNYTLIMRSAMLETLGEDYILTARAKGLSSWAITRRHAFPNARLPLVTQAALSAGFIVGGSITIEYVFSYPGLGLRVLSGIQQRDWPVVQGAFLLITVSVVLANLIADLLYYKLDPRITT